jgi:hypothetical protein
VALPEIYLSANPSEQLAARIRAMQAYRSHDASVRKRKAREALMTGYDSLRKVSIANTILGDLIKSDPLLDPKGASQIRRWLIVQNGCGL